MNRRDFLLSTLSSCFLVKSNPIHAQVFIKDLDLGTRNDTYAQHTRIGEFDAVDTPILINFDNKSLQTWVYVSPNVKTAKLIVFSHDLLVEPQIYLPLFKFLTTHGWIRS
jgi:hypothetical protein